MRVTCPSCAADYDVPDRLLAAGPKVLRCAKCGTTFPAELPAPNLAPPNIVPSSLAPSSLAPPAEIVAIAMPAPQPPASVVPTPEPQAVRVVFHPPMLEPPRPRPRPVGAVWGMVGWIATIVVLAGAGFLVTQDAGKIVAAWPPAARAYAAIGLNPVADSSTSARPAATAVPAKLPPLNRSPAPPP